MRSRSVVLVLCAFLAFPLSGWAQDEKPTLSFDVRISPGKAQGTHEVELLTYLNERLIDKQSWVDDTNCSEDDVITSLPRGLAELGKVDLASRVAEEVLGLDSLPLDKMAAGLGRFEVYTGGRLVQATQFSEGNEGEEPDPNTDPHGCTPTTVSQPPVCVTQPPVTTTHNFNRPCILSLDPCNVPVWGTQACAVNVTVTTTVCTLTTTTTWTPNAPGITCPAPVTISTTNTSSTTQTGTPSCGTCQ